VGEDEGEGGPILLLSTPTLTLPLKGEGIPGRNALKARKIHLIIFCNPFNQERSFSKAPVKIT
jgi:regulator of sirC expression with transglutaminase-like and TPR domain